MIARASEQIAKTLYSTKASAERPFLATVEDEAAQARYVADSVLDHREAGIALRRQAVLFRTAHHSDPLEIELGRRNIPFVKYGGLKFLEAEEGQAARLSAGQDSPRHHPSFEFPRNIPITTLSYAFSFTGLWEALVREPGLTGAPRPPQAKSQAVEIQIGDGCGVEGQQLADD